MDDNPYKKNYKTGKERRKSYSGETSNRMSNEQMRDEQALLSSNAPPVAQRKINITPSYVYQEHAALNTIPNETLAQRINTRPVYLQNESAVLSLSSSHGLQHGVNETPTCSCHQETVALRPPMQQKANMSSGYAGVLDSHPSEGAHRAKQSRENIRTSKIVRGLAAKVDQMQKRLTVAEERIKVLENQRVYYPPAPRTQPPSLPPYHPTSAYYSAPGYYY